MSDVVWVTDLYDRTFNKILYWAKSYDKGKVCATRQFMTKPGEMGPGVEVINMPTAKAVDIAWKEDEMNCMVSVLEVKRPKWPVTWGLSKDAKNWKKGKLIAGGARVINMALFPEALEEVLKVFLEVKNGKGKETESIKDFDFDKILSK